MERLSDEGKDRGFSLVSRILRGIYQILSKLEGPAPADAAVGPGRLCAPSRMGSFEEFEGKPLLQRLL